jgi:hypothetical protein
VPIAGLHHGHMRDASSQARPVLWRKRHKLFS